jgi:hypothetical protein
MTSNGLGAPILEGKLYPAAGTASALPQRHARVDRSEL